MRRTGFGPDLVGLPNAQLPKGGRICRCTSADEGHTWSKAEILYDGPDDDRDPSIVQLKSGLVICNFFSLRKGDKGQLVGLGSWIVTSDDGSVLVVYYEEGTRSSIRAKRFRATRSGIEWLSP